MKKCLNNYQIVYKLYELIDKQEFKQCIDLTNDTAKRDEMEKKDNIDGGIDLNCVLCRANIAVITGNDDSDKTSKTSGKTIMQQVYADRNSSKTRNT